MTAVAETLTLPQAFIDEMIAHAREDTPNECCGVVVRFPEGALKLYRASNAEASPYRFSIPPGELHYLFKSFEEHAADLLVVYHSHTMTEARPSPTDASLSRLLEGPTPWPYWVLVSLAAEPPVVKVWRMQDGQASELSLELGPLPPGSSRCRLEMSGNPRRPVVREVPIVS